MQMNVCRQMLHCRRVWVWSALECSGGLLSVVGQVMMLDKQLHQHIIRHMQQSRRVRQSAGRRRRADLDVHSSRVGLQLAACKGRAIRGQKVHMSNHIYLAGGTHPYWPAPSAFRCERGPWPTSVRCLLPC